LGLTAITVACSGNATPQVNPTLAQVVVPSTTSTPTAIPTQPAVPATLSGDATSIVVNAVKQLPTLSYRKNEWFTNGQGDPPDTSQPPDLVAELTPPSNSYVVWGTNEYLTLDGSFYTRVSGDAWQVSLPGVTALDAASKVATSFTEALTGGTMSIQAGANDTINGLLVQIFIISGSIDVDGNPFPILAKVWIGMDGRLVEMEMDMVDTGQAFDISTFEYDPSIQMPTP
jgi:hypothetical protein